MCELVTVMSFDSDRSERLQPVDIIGSEWKLTLPIGNSKKPVEYLVDGYKSLSNQYFHIRDDKLVFSAPCGGVTTKNTKYSRSELREMINGKKAAWGSDDGVLHTMKYNFACTHLPKKKNQVVIGQIHNDEDDVVEIRLTGSKLEAIHDSTIYGKLTDDYVLGTFINIEITAVDGFITVKGLGNVIRFKAKNKGCYFKIGCYVQSTEENEYGEVLLSRVLVEHGSIKKKNDTCTCV